MADFVKEMVSDKHFALLQDFYGRDLGGVSFLKWKHSLDPHCSAPNEKAGIFYKESERYLGMFVSSRYKFKINGLAFNANLLGDLGIHQQVKSPTVLTDFFLQAKRTDVDVDICFSDDRKVRVYEKIFRKYLAADTQVIKYIELTLKPEKFMAFRFVEREATQRAKFINNLGRAKDGSAFDYLERHPLYQKIYYINHGNTYAVIGYSQECAEILDISTPTREAFCWALSASRYFHDRCRLLIPADFYQDIRGEAVDILSEKRINMLIGHYSKTINHLIPRDVWVCRMDRR